MFVHSVYFWLREDLTEAEREGFVQGLRALPAIPAVRAGYVGVPADTDRPVVDRSYSWALTVVFDDRAGHDAYQTDPAHSRFLADCSGFWKRIAVYDSVD